MAVPLVRVLPHVVRAAQAARTPGRQERRDVLRASLQLNPAVRNELAGPLLRRVLARRAPHVRVDGTDGVVNLAGWTERRSTARLAVSLARAIPGVVEVSDRLEYRLDDE
jgi:hypothetical protein